MAILLNHSIIISKLIQSSIINTLITHYHSFQLKIIKNIIKIVFKVVKLYQIQKRKLWYTQIRVEQLLLFKAEYRLMIVNKMNMDIFNNSFENRHTYKQTGFGEVGVFTGKSYLKKGKEDNFKVDKLV